MYYVNYKTSNLYLLNKDDNIQQKEMRQSLRSVLYFSGKVRAKQRYSQIITKNIIHCIKTLSCRT